ncbi:MAG: divalent-cation tolerance protein CutA [Actinomycetota bacterium]
MDSEFVQVTTTFESEDDAQALAGHLVGARLAACVQVVGPISSTYRWKGEVENAKEWMCLIKSRAALAARIIGAIGEQHSYEMPEITVIPIVSGSAGYLDWIEAETNEESDLGV